MASELNVSTQQVQTILADLGKKVRGPSTVIGVSAAAKVRGRLRAPKPARTVRADVPEPARGPAVVTTTDPAPTTNTVPLPVTTVPAPVTAPIPVPSQSSLFLPPVAPAAVPTAPRTTGDFANPFAVPAARAARPPARPAPSAAAPPRGLAPRPASAPVAPLVAEPEPDYDAEWERRGISPADQEIWLANGLRPSESGVADRCRSADIAPTDLGKKLSGRTALQRLRDGEASTSVWARIREAEQQPRRAGTRLTGRFQLS
nr:hypothetical protein [Nakamurella panacisegetis]